MYSKKIFSIKLKQEITYINNDSFIAFSNLRNVLTREKHDWVKNDVKNITGLNRVSFNRDRYLSKY